MKRLLAFLALCIPLYLFAQGFGSFSHDQPFFAKDAVASIPDYDSLLPSGIRNRWKSTSLSSSPVTAWVDSVSGVILTNVTTGPTWETNVVKFNGTSQFLAVSNATVNTSIATQWLLVVKRTKTIADGDFQFVLNSKTSQFITGWYNDSGNTAWSSANVVAVATSPINIWQDLLFAGHNAGVNQTQAYTNGIGVLTSATDMVQIYTFNFLGKAADNSFYAGFELSELIIWTNSQVNFTATSVSNIHMYVTNTYPVVSP